MKTHRFETLLITMLFCCASLYVPTAAAATAGGSASSSGGSGMGNLKGLFSSSDEGERQAQIQSFLVAIIGGLLRHPDPKVRSQAIQSLLGGMAGNSSSSGSTSGNNSSGSSGGGLGQLFSVQGTGSGGGANGSSGATGLGGAVFVPDFYILLADPDEEVRDMASVALDVLFNTNVTLMRMMSDPDPLIRKYATRAFVISNFSNSSSGSSNNSNSNNSNNSSGGQSATQLLSLRTLIVHLRYEKDPTVRKSITDALDWYSLGGGSGGSGSSGRGGGSTGSIFGTDATILQYLDDSNPDVKKNAIRIASEMEFNQAIFARFLDMLKVETNDDIKAALNEGIDKQLQKQQNMSTGGTGKKGP